MCLFRFSEVQEIPYTLCDSNVRGGLRRQLSAQLLCQAPEKPKRSTKAPANVGWTLLTYSILHLSRSDAYSTPNPIEHKILTALHINCRWDPA